jgi:hypothetical protein
MTETSERRRRTTRNTGGPVGLLQSPRFGRWLFMGMTLLAAGYVAYGMRQAWIGSVMYGPGYLGMTRAETRYIYGAPTVGGERDAAWRYREAGAISSFHFDRGVVSRLGCSAEAEGGASCPEAHGIGIGTSEERIWSVLGMPPVQIYRENAKIIAYPGLGTRFLLRRLQVVAIEQRPSAGVLPFTMASLRLLAP